MISQPPPRTDPWYRSPVHAPMIAGAALALAVGCGDASPGSDGTPVPGAPPAETTTSYLRDIQPILQRSCVGCHYAGGIAPFPLETPEQAIAFAAAIESAVVDRRMPPFQAGEGCNDYKRDLRLPQKEIDLISAWVAEGRPMGSMDHARSGLPPPAPEIRADITMTAGAPFDAQSMRTDEYRCFVLDPNATEDLAVVAQDVLPGNPAIVHHVLAYVVAPENVQELLDKDAAEPGLGYTCFGGPGVTGAALNQIAGWVPGRGAQRTPPGTALRLPARSLIVMQVHYNLLTVDRDQRALDETAIVLETEPASASTLVLGRILPVAQPNLNIPAGEANVVMTNSIRLPRFTPTQNVYTVMGHMHQLGSRFRLVVEKASGEQECLLDIPRWDFDWQQTFELMSPVQITGGDTVHIRCEYDNSPANQVVVDGRPRDPVDVRWGEGSLDEMCLGYVFVAGT